MTDLELVETDELVDELERRYDYCIFAGIVIRKEREIDIFRRWKGSPHTCMGLCDDVSHLIWLEMQQSLKQ